MVKNLESLMWGEWEENSEENRCKKGYERWEDEPVI